ncbi:MAG: AAA family ATPase [Candidatus Marithrix sp.]
MFETIRIKNFRTHIDTSINLSDLTLVIGANNSGKSNLLAGISHFAKLVSRAYPGNKRDKTISYNDFFPHRHSLCDEKEPMSFYCSWKKDIYHFEYDLVLIPDVRKILCKEKLKISDNREFTHGYDLNSSEILLRTKISEQGIGKELLSVIEIFFRSLSFAFYYNLQPSFLNGTGIPFKYNHSLQDFTSASHTNFCQQYEEQGKRPNIAIGLGEQGYNFQELIKYVTKHDDHTYGRFRGYLQRFVKSFNGIIIERSGVKWQFDMGENNFPYYDAEKVSDGLLKAGAVALLCSMKTPPSVIMLEEVENGINQKNLKEFLAWLKATSHLNATQFILTSHSPSVIREFNKNLNDVYSVVLKEKNRYESKITNLNDALNPLVDIGAVNEDAIIGYKEKDGKKIVQIRAYELTELFYNGVLGNL